MTKPGRPKKKVKRERVIAVRVNEKEFKMVEAAATKQGLAMSAWIRAMILRS